LPWIAAVVASWVAQPATAAAVPATVLIPSESGQSLLALVPAPSGAGLAGAW
jgi:hypothetical protein